MLDEQTESVCRALTTTINANVRKVAAVAGEVEARNLIEAQQRRVWNTDELARDFDVLGFAAPLVVVRRRADAVKGSLFFSHEPRFYWGFRADEATERAK